MRAYASVDGEGELVTDDAQALIEQLKAAV
jgi:hypothetical protein